MIKRGRSGQEKGFNRHRSYDLHAPKSGRNHTSRSRIGRIILAAVRILSSTSGLDWRNVLIFGKVLDVASDVDDPKKHALILFCWSAP